MPVWIETNGIRSKQKTNISFPATFLTEDLPSTNRAPYIDPNQFVLRPSLETSTKGKFEIVTSVMLRKNAIDMQKMGDPDAIIYTITKPVLDNLEAFYGRRGIRMRYFRIEDKQWHNGTLDIT